MENNIESLFVPYQIALDMKSIGFNEPCFGCYFHNNKNLVEYNPDGIPFNHNNRNSRISSPTYSQCFKWFRQKYGLMHIINPYDFTAEINYLNKRVVDNVYGDFIPHDHLVDDEGEEIKHLSYEEAETACLLELINICKKK
jgi:hypothetical protein